MLEFIKINPIDAVAVALTPLEKGRELQVDDVTVTLIEDIPQGHKFALKDIPEGTSVIKYGNSIGNASKDIKKGGWVHTHNITTGLGEILDYTYHPTQNPLPDRKERMFMGFRRTDGKVGIRNEIWIIPTVGCINGIAESVEREAEIYKGNGVDDIIAFGHPYGCSQMGDDQESTRLILCDMIQHPNAAGVLVLGLGCENSNIDEIRRVLGDFDENRVKFLAAQDVEDEVEESLKLIEELVEYVKTFKREPMPASELVVGLKCGGSDGLSGITANPTVGAFSDLVVAAGGTTILTEVPEMFGAETLLMNRCDTEQTFEKTVELINGFKRYFESHNQTIYENPSPGNKAGGITTLEDKSLGCVQKSGSAPVTDVLAYGDIASKKGLNLLSAPGNDLIAATSLACSGAQIVLFTTGRGTPFACPVPTMKISSNNTMYEKKHRWIDFNCGTIVSGEDTIPGLAEKLFDYVIKVASGELVKSEVAGYHDFAIFKTGVTL